MENDTPIQFDKFKKDPNNAQVKCAHCGERIPASSAQCPHCGVHFQGEAQDFTHPSEISYTPRKTWLVKTLIWILIFFLIAGLLAMIYSRM